MKKTTLFVGGLASGLILSQTWRALTKQGIKFGIRAGRKVRELSQRAIEDLGDVTAEAAEEMQREEEEVNL